jgi:triphosphoribosyl-dephospho-CoA synthase
VREANLALLQTLLHLMAWNDDTNLVSRGGWKDLIMFSRRHKNYYGKGVLVEGGIEAMQQLDDELIARNLSPVAVLIYWQ